jgi:hypothetical protein
VEAAFARDLMASQGSSPDRSQYRQANQRSNARNRVLHIENPM